MLSASVLESAENLLDAFKLGKTRNIVIVGGKLKVLLLIIGEHKVSVFMEKNVNHDKLYKKLK